MAKVTKNRKTILRSFLEHFKAKKQENDSKHSYQKAQERTLARKAALARKRAREAATKHKETIDKLLEPDTLLPNQEGTGMSGVYNQGQMGSSQAYALTSAVELQHRIAQQALPINKDPLIQPIGESIDTGTSE